MPQEEDFGYTSLEAQFFGCPVISYAKGGTAETVIENKTGLFFDQQNVKSLTNIIALFEKNTKNIKRLTVENGPLNCQKFDKKIYQSLSTPSGVTSAYLS